MDLREISEWNVGDWFAHIAVGVALLAFIWAVLLAGIACTMAVRASWFVAQ
jgi:hypothetical protein